ncbi:MAG: hypothetical protein OXP71_02825 [Candidatus Poribacteria bacterium]|nr:hypothetical protein [Candidatus Poribacteria bacterium]
MKDKDSKKCRRPARKQFPVKGYEYTVFCLLLTATFLIGLVYPVAAHSQLSFLKLGKDESAYGFGLQFMENTPIVSDALEFGIDFGAKVQGAGGMRFVDDDTVDFRPGVEIPPLPSI